MALTKELLLSPAVANGLADVGNEPILRLSHMTETALEIRAEEAFALMLETACEDFEILQALIDGQIQVGSPKSDEFRSAGGRDYRRDHQAARADPRIQMALAKSFVFNARRANRICTLNKGSLPLGRLERTRFKGYAVPIAVRDVHEHGFDGNGSVKPSMHKQEGGTLDETALVVDGRQEILMDRLIFITSMSRWTGRVSWLASLRYMKRRRALHGS